MEDDKIREKPPMVLKQEEMFFLGQNNQLKMFFDTRHVKDENAENFDSGRQYLFMSPKEYVYKSWVEIREE